MSSPDTPPSDFTAEGVYLAKDTFLGIPEAGKLRKLVGQLDHPVLKETTEKDKDTVRKKIVSQHHISSQKTIWEQSTLDQDLNWEKNVTAPIQAPPTLDTNTLGLKEWDRK